MKIQIQSWILTDDNLAKLLIICHYIGVEWYCAIVLDCIHNTMYLI